MGSVFDSTRKYGYTLEFEETRPKEEDPKTSPSSLDMLTKDLALFKSKKFKSSKKPSYRSAFQSALGSGSTSFAQAVLPLLANISPKIRHKDINPLPKRELTRVLTGDVPPRIYFRTGTYAKRSR